MRALPRVPLVVFADDPSAPAAPAPVPPVARAAADQADVALGQLHGLSRRVADRRASLDVAMAAAIAACHGLAAELAASTPRVPAEDVPARLPIHEYFGVRQAPVNPAQVATQAAMVVYRGLVDLQFALIDVNDMTTEVATMRLTLADVIGPAASGASAGLAEARELAAADAEYQPTGAGLERWIVAHHVYFLFNLRAAAEVHAGLGALARGETVAAAGHLARAAHYVRGFTAAMAHSTAMPADYYAQQVRHTMGPPNAPVNLTGGMQPQHKAFRAAIRRLVDALPDVHSELAAREPGLAAARAALLEADLIDIERHAHIADKLVGSDHSLVQRENGKENAVSMLRTMRHLRAARYAPLMPFGDQLVTSAVAHPA
jgi:hypothetical protein